MAKKKKLPENEPPTATITPGLNLNHLTEETVQMANGRICQILIQTSPILSDHGDVAAVVEMATNITQVKIEQKIQRNIFEEFFSTKGSAGTGLGLAVVEKVANRHVGKTEVTSTPGKGTKFKIMFRIK